ncbi:MAG: hypothetical protein ACI85O_003403 [Saprospiraceae bacterium]|jgi:hypothetical protein
MDFFIFVSLKLIIFSFIMFQFILIITVAYFFFRWADKNRLPSSKNEPRVQHHDSQKRKSDKQKNDDEGDYIDYEEIKD